MPRRNFRDMIEAKWAEGKFVCVGLDTEVEKLPQYIRLSYQGNIRRMILVFNEDIVRTTYDLVCAYKPNVAFYAAHGADGWLALKYTIEHIRRCAPDVPVILDAKVADIGNTNNGYTQMAFNYLEADAITVHPYLGSEALKPFLDRADKGVIVLCRTSNPGAGEFQNLPLDSDTHIRPIGRMTAFNGTLLYQQVAYRVAHFWSKNGNCALVVGATYPEELREVRKIVGDMPILIPGIGAQGGDLEKTVDAGKNSRGRGMIINSSRGIIFASSGSDYAEAARRETLNLDRAITECLKKGAVT